MTNAIMTNDQMLEISRNNVQAIAGINQELLVQRKEIKALSMTVQDLTQRMDYIEYQQPISANQREIIRNKVAKKVYDILGDRKSKRLISVAFPMAYRCLKPYGYRTANSTERKFFDDIIEALNSGVINFTYQDVKRRREEIDEENEERK